MINTRSEILTLLQGTMLSNAKVIELEIPESQERAFAIEINPDNGYAAWALMHSMIPKTGRYPVIVNDIPDYPVPIPDWEESIRKMDFFSRSSYEGDRERDGGTSPQEIIDRAKTFDVDKYIEAEDEDFLLWQFDEDEIEYSLINAIEGLEKRYGKAPTIEELLAALDLSGRELGVNISGEDIHEVKLDRWLFEWELANVDYEKATTYEGKIYARDWFTDLCQNKYAIILLPTPNSWETLAYIHWYGSFYPGSECAIAFLKRWYDTYQAELVCHFYTVLNLNVGRLPQTPMEAFNLTVEQFTLSDYGMRHNFGIRDYALYLMKVEHWCFHERP